MDAKVLFKKRLHQCLYLKHDFNAPFLAPITVNLRQMSYIELQKTKYSTF